MSWGGPPQCRPGGAIARGERAGIGGGHGQRHVASQRGQPVGALVAARDVPQRRMGTLHGLDHQRDVLQAEELAGVIQPLGAEALEHDLQRLIEALLGGVGRDAEERRLVGRGAAADAELEPPAAHDVEHADLFD